MGVFIMKLRCKTYIHISLFLMLNGMGGALAMDSGTPPDDKKAGWFTGSWFGGGSPSSSPEVSDAEATQNYVAESIALPPRDNSLTAIAARAAAEVIADRALPSLMPSIARTAENVQALSQEIRDAGLVPAVTSMVQALNGLTRSVNEGQLVPKIGAAVQTLDKVASGLDESKIVSKFGDLAEKFGTLATSLNDAKLPEKVGSALDKFDAFAEIMNNAAVSMNKLVEKVGGAVKTLDAFANDMRELTPQLQATLKNSQEVTTHLAQVTGEVRQGLEKAKGMAPNLPENTSAAVQNLTDMVVQGAAKGELAKTIVKPAVTVITDQVREGITEPFIESVKKEGETFFEKYATQRNLLIGAGIIVGAVATYFTLRFVFNRLEKWFNKPTFNYTLVKAQSGDSSIDDDVFVTMKEMIFSPGVRDRLNTVMITTSSIKAEQMMRRDGDATYRNLFLYGPPGSGKRLFARHIADNAKMDFYELPGSSLTKYKDGDAAAAVYNFFRMVSNSTPQGAVVYINNAELLLTSQKATTTEAAATVNSLVSAFVEQLEKRSNTCMVILASSLEPESMGDIARGIDDIISIKRPALEERIKGIKLYRDKFLLGGDEVRVDFADSVLTHFGDEKIRDIAMQLEGATIGDIHDYIKSVRDEVRLEGFVSTELLDRVTQRTVERYKAIIH